MWEYRALGGFGPCGLCIKCRQRLDAHLDRSCGVFPTISLLSPVLCCHSRGATTALCTFFPLASSTIFSAGFKHNFFRHGFCLPVGQLHLPAVLSVLVASGTDCGTQRVTVGQSTGLRHICPSLAGSAFPAPLAGTSAGWELWGAEILNALWQE